MQRHSARSAKDFLLVSIPPDTTQTEAYQIIQAWVDRMRRRNAKRDDVRCYDVDIHRPLGQEDYVIKGTTRYSHRPESSRPKLVGNLNRTIHHRER